MKTLLKHIRMIRGKLIQKMDKRRVTRRLIVEVLSDRLPLAIDMQLVKDINTLPETIGSQPDSFIQVNDVFYFIAATNTAGRELWKSDGTPDGTVLVKDIYQPSVQGSSDSLPVRLTNVNGTLFFVANDGITGAELWKSDGTKNGTMLVKDLHPFQSSFPDHLTNVNGVLYFQASSNTTGKELWKSDGTENGTVMVKDIRAGIASSTPSYFTNVNGTLFFTANDGTNGIELWKSDGTEAGTVLVKDVSSGTASSNPNSFANVNGVLYFSAGNVASGSELWKSDGTNSGTVLVRDIRPGGYGSAPNSLVNVNGTLFFLANDGINGEELWKSDGTNTGTQLIKDIRTGTGDSSDVFLSSSLINLNGVLFFLANDGINGRELWKSDGTSFGTTIVKDIYDGSNSSSPSYLTNVNGTLYFRADGDTSSIALWKSDGTVAGTQMVREFNGASASNFRSFANFAGMLVFQSRDSSNASELWKSDGTEPGTVMLKDIRNGNRNSVPHELENVNGTLFFTANSGPVGYELWKSDGTESGTVLVKDIRAGSYDSMPQQLTNVNGVLFFVASDGINGLEIWKSDGTESGTLMVKNIRAQSDSYQPRLLTNVNGILFFKVHDGIHGYELWKSDGTNEGTVLVEDILPGTTSSQFSGPRDLTNVNGVLYFRAASSGSGYELWKSDGTEIGTTLVKDINPGPGSSHPVSFSYPDVQSSGLYNANGVLYFRANDGVNGLELWKSDGTESGTVMVKNIGSGNASSYASPLQVMEDSLFFRANDGINGFELWKTDGTDAGTQLVKDIRAGASGSSPNASVVVDNTLFFVANDGVAGQGIWKSDGTASGTKLLKPINPSFIFPSLQGIVSLNGTIFFRATGGIHGDELWMSDGTESGTVLVSSLTTTLGTQEPNDLMVVGDTLFYSADSDAYGVELWKIKEDKPSTDILLTNNLIEENAGSNALIGELSTVDPDTDSGFIYSLVSGQGDTDNSSFSITGTTLRTTTSFDFESKPSLSIRIRSTDPIGQTLEKVFVIVVSDLNEPPVNIVLTPNSIQENSAVNAIVGELTTNDPDAGNTFVYTLVSGAGDDDNAVFSLDGAVLRTNVSFDFETKSSYTIRVRSADQNGLFVEKSLEVVVTNQNEPPIDIDLSPKIVAENLFANSTVGTLSTFDPDAGNTFVYELVAGSGDIDNASFNISGAILRTTAPFNFEAKSSYTIRVRTTDQGGLSYEKPLIVSVTDVNEAPTDIELSPKTIPENAGPNATVGTLNAIDPDAGNTFTYALVTGLGGNDNSQFNISGSTLRANNSFNFEAKNNYSIRVSATDQNGLSTVKVITVTVTNVNEAPTDIDLSPKTIAENAGPNAIVGSISTTDPDIANTFTYSLVAGSGDSNNSEFNVVGNTLVAKSGFNFESKSSYNVRIRSTDQNGLFFEKTITILVTNVNESPVDIDLSPKTIAENAGANAVVGTLSTIDPDAANTFTYSLVVGSGDTDNASFQITGNTLRATNSFNYESKSSYSIRVRTIDQNGLSFEKSFAVSVTDSNEAPLNIDLSPKSIAENAGSNASVGVLSTIDPDAANTFTYTLVTGIGDSDNASFNINGNTLRATNNLNYESKANYNIRIRSSDQNGLFTERTFIVAVTNVNEPPVDIDLSPKTIAENAGTDATVGILSTTDPDAANTFFYSFVAGSGNADNSVFQISGNAIKAATSFNFESKSSYSVRVRSTDQNGLFTEKAFIIAVTNVNEAPIDIELSPTTIAENAGVNTTVGTLSTNDPDAVNTFTYSLVTGAGDTDNPAFHISSNAIKATNSFNFESKSSYSIRVRSTDQNGLFTEKAFVIAVTDVNEAPVEIELTAQTISENAGSNATVGSLSTSDPDAANTFTYSLATGTGDTNNAAFQIVGNTLKALGSFDYESKSNYSVRLRTTDQNGLFTEKTFVIAVTNVNESPVDIDLTPKTITENGGSNATVGSLSTIDPDAANTFIYTLVAGLGDADNSSFQISGNTFKATTSFNFESKSSYSVRVRSTDQNGLFTEKTFVIAVTNVNEAPIDIDLSSATIAENAGVNTTVGTLSTIDPDANNTFTYSLVTGTGDADNSAFQIVGNTLKAISNFNFESKSNYNLRIRSSDQNGLFIEKTFVVTVTNVNEAPTEIVLSQTSWNLEEGRTNADSIHLATITVLDDVLGSVVFSLAGADADQFEIRNETLWLKPGTQFNYEEKSSYQVQVTAFDPSISGSTPVSREFVLHVDNVPEVVGVNIVDGLGWNGSVKRIQITWDMPATLSNTAIRWTKMDVGSAEVSFDFASSVVNGKSVADVLFKGSFVDEKGLIDGVYDLTVRGDQVIAVNSMHKGLDFNQRYVAIRPESSVKMQIENESPVLIGDQFALGIRLTGVNQSTNDIVYKIDWNSDGVADRTVIGGPSITLDDVRFTSGGSRTIQIEAFQAGTSLAKGRSVIDVVPYLTSASRWLSTLDVDSDTTVSPLDVLRIVNKLNDTSLAQVYELRLDVDRDQTISPLDVLAIVNHLNSSSSNDLPSPFSSISMNDTGATDGFTSNSSVVGTIKDRNAKLYAALDGNPKIEVEGLVDSNGHFAITDAVLTELFGTTLDGDHILTLGTVSSDGAWQAMDRYFTKSSRIPTSFDIVTAVQNGKLRLAWTSAGEGVRYQVLRNVSGQSPQVLVAGLADLSIQLNLEPGSHDLFVEAVDHLGNKSSSQVVRVFID